MITQIKICKLFLAAIGNILPFKKYWGNGNWFKYLVTGGIVQQIGKLYY